MYSRQRWHFNFGIKANNAVRMGWVVVDEVVLGANFMGSFLLKGVELGSMWVLRGMMMIIMKVKFRSYEMWGVK